MIINIFYLLFLLISIVLLLLILILNYLKKDNSIKIIDENFFKYSNNYIFFENLKRINFDFLVIKMKKITDYNEEYYFGEEEFKIKNRIYKIKIKIYNNSELPIFE